MNMDFRKNITFYKEAEALAKKRILGIMLYKFIAFILTSGVILTRLAVFAYDILQSNLALGQEEVMRYLAVSMGRNAFFDIIILIISFVLSLTLGMEILNSFKTGKFNILNLFNHLNEKPLEIILCASLYGLILSVIKNIPIIGIILSIIIGLMLAYLPYLLLEKQLKFIEYFKESYNLTMGHKMELFKIKFRYFLIQAASWVACIVLAAIFYAINFYVFAIGIAILFIVVNLFNFIIDAIHDVAIAYYYQQHQLYESSLTQLNNQNINN